MSRPNRAVLALLVVTSLWAPVDATGLRRALRRGNRVRRSAVPITTTKEHVIAYTPEQIADAKNAIRRGVALRLIDLPIANVSVSDEDATRYLDGTTIDQLLAEAR